MKKKHYGNYEKKNKIIVRVQKEKCNLIYFLHLKSHQKIL